MNLTDLFKLSTLIKFANDARATGNQSAYHDIIDRLGRSPMNSLATSGASISGYVSDIQAIIKDAQRIVSSDASWSYKMSTVAELLNSIQIGEGYLKTDDLTLSELAHGITHPADLMSPDYQGFSKYVVVSNVNKIPNRARLSNIVSGTARIASMPATASDYQSIVNDIGELDASNVDDQARALGQLASDTGKLTRSAGPSLANDMGLSSVAAAAAGQATALPIDNKLNSLGIGTKFRDVINKASAYGDYSLLNRTASYAKRDFSSAANAGTFINSFVNDLHSVKGFANSSVGAKLNDVAHDSAVSNFYRVAKDNHSLTDDILSNLADFSASHAAYNLNNVSHDIRANASFAGINTLNRIAANASSQADAITKNDARDDLVDHEIPALFSDVIDRIASNQLDRPIFSSFIGDVKRRLSDYVLDFNGLFGFIPDFKKALFHAGYNGERASRLVAGLIRLASDPDLKSAYDVVRSRPLSGYTKAILDDLSGMTSVNEVSKLNDIASIVKAHFVNNSTLRRCGYSRPIDSLAASASSKAADLSRNQSVAADKAYGSFLNHDLDSLVSSGIAAVSRSGFDRADFKILVSNAEEDLSSANVSDFVNKLATQAGAFNGATTMNIKNGLGSLADNPKLNEAYQSMSNNSKATDSILNDLSGMTSDNWADELNDIASVAGDNFSNASMFGSFAADTSSIAANAARSSLANSFVDTLVADVNGGSLNKVTNDLSEIDHDPKYRTVRTSPNVIKEVHVARGAVKTMACTAIDSMIINVLGSNPVESLGILRHAVKNLTNRDLQATFNGQLNAIKSDLLNNNKNNEVNFKTQLISFVANVKGEEVSRLSADGDAALERIYNYIEAPVHARFKTVLMTKIIPLLLDIANRRLDSNGANDHVKNDLNEIYGTVRFYNAAALNSFLNVIYSHARDYGQTPASVSSVAGLVPQIVDTVTQSDFDRVHFDQVMEAVKNDLETNRSLSDLWSHVKATLGVRTFIRRHGDLSGIITGILDISSSTLKALNAAYVEGHTDENVKKILTDLEIIANNSKDPNGDSTAAKNHAVKHALNDIHNRLNDETLKQIDGVAGPYGLDRAVIKAKDDYNPKVSVPRRAKKPVSSSVSSASNRAAAASESSSSSSSKPKDSRAVASAFAKANADHYLKSSVDDGSVTSRHSISKSSRPKQDSPAPERPKVVKRAPEAIKPNVLLVNMLIQPALKVMTGPKFDSVRFDLAVDNVKNRLSSTGTLLQLWNQIKSRPSVTAFIKRGGSVTTAILNVLSGDRAKSLNAAYAQVHGESALKNILDDLKKIAGAKLDANGKNGTVHQVLRDIVSRINGNHKLNTVPGMKDVKDSISRKAGEFAPVSLPINSGRAAVILGRLTSQEFDRTRFVSAISVVKNALISQNSLKDFWDAIKDKAPIKTFTDRNGKLTSRVVKIIKNGADYNDAYQVAHQDFLSVNHVLSDLTDVARSGDDHGRIDKDVRDVAKVIRHDPKLNAISGLKTIAADIYKDVVNRAKRKKRRQAASKASSSASVARKARNIASRSAASSASRSNSVSQARASEAKAKANRHEASNANASLISNYVALNNARQSAFSANGAGFSDGIGTSNTASQAESAAQYAFNAVNTLPNNSAADSARKDANLANLNAASAQREVSLVQRQQFRASRDYKKASETDDLASARSYASDAKIAASRVISASNDASEYRDLAIKAANDAGGDANNAKSKRTRKLAGRRSSTVSAPASSASSAVSRAPRASSQAGQSHDNSSNDSYYASLSNSVKSASASVSAKISAEDSYERSLASSEASKASASSSNKSSIMSSESATIERDRWVISGDSSQVAYNLANSNVKNDPQISSAINYDRELMKQLNNGVNVDALSPNSSTADNANKSVALAVSITNDTYGLLSSASASASAVSASQASYERRKIASSVDSQLAESRSESFNTNEDVGSIRNNADLPASDSANFADDGTKLSNQNQQSSQLPQTNGNDNKAVATVLVSVGALLSMIGKALNDDKDRYLK